MSKSGPKLATVARVKALTEVQTGMVLIFEGTEKLHLILVLLLCVGMTIVIEMAPPSSFRSKENADAEAKEGCGACSYGKTVESPPISKLTAAVGHYIFRQGYGCGACYEVKCTDNAACSGKPVTVVVSDECPSCSGYHFNLSGAAFASIANPGQQDILRKLGQVNLQYRRVSCSFGRSIAFRMGENSEPNKLEVSMEYVNGDADIHIENGPEQGLEISHVWGATWSVFAGGYAIQPPFNFTLVQRYPDGTKGKTILVPNIFTQDWKIGQVYQSTINF
ncbi:putative expansin-B2 [Arachis ipaensis]|uniref:putative expansin-B2 n=1 Tax=Arachis ipaensis TaxID=130454 RepID=UPI0007AFD2FF|nr:putative expansin-B2 [Arachis ipaensis]